MIPPDHHARRNRAHSNHGHSDMCNSVGTGVEAREEEWSGGGDSEVQHME